MTPRLLVVLWASLCHAFGPPVVFLLWDLPFPSVFVGANFWVTSVMPVFKQIQLALFCCAVLVPSLFIPSCIVIVTIFCSCVLLRYYVSLLYMVTRSMHSLFISFSTSVVCFWFCIMKSSLPKVVQPRPILHLNSCLFLIMVFCHHLPEVDVAVDFFNLPSIGADVHFVKYRIAHDFSLSQVHIETYWFAAFIDVLYHLLQFNSAISTIPSAKIRWDKHSPLILIPLFYQFILLMIASCRHDVKSLGDILSPCLKISAVWISHYLCIDKSQTLPCGTSVLWYWGKPCWLHVSPEHRRLAQTQCCWKLTNGPLMQNTVGCCTHVLFLGLG